MPLPTPRIFPYNISVINNKVFFRQVFTLSQTAENTVSQDKVNVKAHLEK